MTYGKRSATSALQWLSKGWALFLMAPLPWLIITVLYLLVSIALSMLPLLGPLVAALAWPGLTGGLLLSARVVDQQGTPGPGTLFAAFSDPSTRTPMLLLGLAPAAMLLLGIVVLVLIIGGAAGTGVVTGSDAAAITTLVAGGLLAPVIALILAAAVAAALIYAVPLVLFDGARPLAAMEQSILASLGNALPLLLLGAIYIAAAVVAAIPFGLGFLALIPVTAGALYASYVDIWGAPGDEPTEGGRYDVAEPR